MRAARNPRSQAGFSQRPAIRKLVCRGTPSSGCFFPFAPNFFNKTRAPYLRPPRLPTAPARHGYGRGHVVAGPPPAARLARARSGAFAS